MRSAAVLAFAVASVCSGSTPCTPLPICVDNGNVSPCATPTPVIQAECPDCVLNPPALVRVYARPDDSPSWTWHVDLPYVPADPLQESSAFAPTIDLGWPIQRAVPAGNERTLIDVVIKMVRSDGLESAPSNILQVCMSPVCAAPGPCS